MKKKQKIKCKKKRKKEIVRKINDNNFWLILEANFGYFQETANAIENLLGIKYTRQAVFERANSNPDRLDQIREATTDHAELTIRKNMDSIDPRVSQKAAEFHCKTIGKKRGYYEKSEVHLSGKEVDDAIDRELARVAGRDKK